METPGESKPMLFDCCALDSAKRVPRGQEDYKRENPHSACETSGVTKRNITERHMPQGKVPARTAAYCEGGG